MSASFIFFVIAKFATTGHQKGYGYFPTSRTIEAYRGMEHDASARVVRSCIDALREELHLLTAKGMSLSDDNKLVYREIESVLLPFLRRRGEFRVYAFLFWLSRSVTLSLCNVSAKLQVLSDKGKMTEDRWTAFYVFSLLFSSQKSKRYSL